jgi:hypothetical protein
MPSMRLEVNTDELQTEPERHRLLRTQLPHLPLTPFAAICHPSGDIMAAMWNISATWYIRIQGLLKVRMPSRKARKLSHVQGWMRKS